MRNAADILREAAELHDEKREEYKDSVIRFGKVMDALFPDQQGERIDSIRLGLITQKVGKLVRYAVACENGAVMNPDHLNDDMVYTALLQEQDEIIREKKYPKLDEDQMDEAHAKYQETS